MTTPLPPPPPGRLQPTARPTRPHPLAVASLTLSVLGFVPLIIVGGLLGSLLGALALGAVRRSPDRYGGEGLAMAGLGVGMVSGVLVLGTFSIVRSDDWGWSPLLATVAYAGLVLGLAARARTTAGRATGAAAAGVVGILAAGAMIIGLVLLITLAFTTIFEGFLDAILGRS